MIAPPAPNDVIHHIAFDTPGRRELYKPIVGRAWAVKLLGLAPGVDPARYADFDKAMIEDVLQSIVRVSNGDVGWVWADEAGRMPEITFQIVPGFAFDPNFRGGVCWPTVSSGLLLSARLEWTPWEHGHELFWGSGAHEAAHGMLGFGHTADRQKDHIMGSAAWGQRDFSDDEYATWQYMRNMPPGALNPRMLDTPRGASYSTKSLCVRCPQ